MIPTRRAVAVVAVLLLVGGASLAGGVALAQEGDTGSIDYTLEELKQDGKHYSQPSARIVPEEGRVYWLEHRPVNQPWKTVTKEGGGQKLGEDATLKTNSVYLRTIRASTGTETVNVTVVSYDTESTTVTEGNTTRTVETATNVTETTQQLTLGPGWSLAEISLPHHDDTKQVTMWMEEHPDTARWTFPHKSVATTTPINIQTWSGFLVFAGGFVILPALGGGAYGARKVRQWVQKAGSPPGHGAGYYLGLTIAATVGIVMWIYYQAAEVIVAAPFVLGLGVAVSYVGYMLSTHEGRSERKLFWQPHIQSVEAFSKSKVPTFGAGNDDDSVAFSEDMPFGQFQVHSVLDEGQNGLSVVRDGWMAFLARLKGGRARIVNANELKTRFSAWNSPWDEVFIVHPNADTLMEYEPPGLRLKTPEINGWTDLVWPIAIIGGGSTVAWQLAQIYGATAWAAMLVTVPVLVWTYAVEGTDSRVYVEPAPAATRSALATALVVELGFNEAADLEDMEELAARALAENDKEGRDFLRRMVDADVDQRFNTHTDDGIHPDVEQVDTKKPEVADDD